MNFSINTKSKDELMLGLESDGLCTVSPAQAKFWTWAGTVRYLHGSCAGDKKLFSSQTEAQS